MSLKIKLLGWFDRIPTSQTLSLGLVAVTVGVATGTGVGLFKMFTSVLCAKKDPIVNYCKVFYKEIHGK